MSNAVYGKIIKIINNYQFVINLGKKDGIKEDFIVHVYLPLEIKTDSGKTETLELKIVDLKIIDVYDKFSLCLSNEFTNTLNGLELFNDQIAPLKVDESKNEKINIENYEITIGTNVKVNLINESLMNNPDLPF